MILKTRHWGPDGPDRVLCVHGISQHGGIFEGLGERLGAAGRSVTAVDLRGHGGSARQPPWDTGTHVGDLLETVESLGIDSAVWVGHSFGARVAAELATRFRERCRQLVLLEPGLDVPPDRALRSAEIERLDWSFATVEGAVNALLSNDAIVASPRDVVAKFVREDVRKGADGRFRFSFCPSAVVVAWSEMVLPAPPIACLPTLLVKAEVGLYDEGARLRRYTDELGDLLTVAEVPNGHNVLWESPQETISAVERFLEPLLGGSAAD